MPLFILGLLQRWQQFWQSGACKKDRALGKSNKTLGVKNFISAFILLLSGIFLCLLFLGLEHVFYRYIRPKLKNWDCYGCCGLSMGQLLSFEQSVDQTVGLVKQHKCSNPICEAHIWRNRYEMQEMAKKINKLEATLYKKQALIDHFRHSNMKSSQIAMKEATDPTSIQRYLQLETQSQRTRQSYDEPVKLGAKFSQQKHHPHCSLSHLASMDYCSEEPVRLMEYTDDNIPVTHGLLSGGSRESKHSLKKGDYMNRHSHNCDEVEIILPRKQSFSGKLQVYDASGENSFNEYSRNNHIDPSQRTTFYDDSGSSNLTLEHQLNNQCFDKPPPPYENFNIQTAASKLTSWQGSATTNSGALQVHTYDQSSNFTLPHSGYHQQQQQQHHFKQPAYISSPPQHTCSHQKQAAPSSHQPLLQQSHTNFNAPASSGQSLTVSQKPQNSSSTSTNSAGKSPGKKTVSCGIMRVDHKSGDAQSKSRKQGPADAIASDVIMIEKESCL